MVIATAAMLVVSLLAAAPAANAVSGNFPSGFLSLGIGYFDNLVNPGGPTTNPVCLAPTGSANGSPVVQSPCVADPMWQRLDSGDYPGWVYLQLASTATTTSPMCVDTADGGTAPGTALVIGRCTFSATQRWRFDATTLQWSNSAGCITGYAIADSHGKFVDAAYPCANAANQQVLPIYRSATIRAASPNTTVRFEGWDLFHKKVHTGDGKNVTIFAGTYLAFVVVPRTGCLELDRQASSGTFFTPTTVHYDASWSLEVPNERIDARQATFSDATTQVFMRDCFP